ncbi:MAG: TolC family protein [Desulfuromonadales bacterium]|nr:TolC family protein [Desulfuromonadales bacterium]
MFIRLHQRSPSVFFAACLVLALCSPVWSLQRQEIEIATPAASEAASVSQADVGQESTTLKALTLEQCYASALQNHPEIAVKTARIGEAKALMESESVSRSAVVSLHSQLGYMDGQAIGTYGLVTNRQEDENFNGEYLNGRIVADLPIYSHGALWNQTSGRDLSAEFALKAAEYDRTAVAHVIKRRVGDKYYLLHQLKKAKEVHKQLEKTAQARYAEASVAYELDRISKEELLKANGFLKTAQSDSLEIDLLYQKNKRHMGLLLGIDLGVLRLRDIALSAEELDSFELMVGDNVKNHPRVLAQQARVEKVERTVGMVDDDALPRLDLMASYGVGTDFDRSSDNVLVTLDLKYDLYDSGQNVREKSLAMNRMKVEQAWLREILLELQQESLETVYRFKLLKERLALLEEQAVQLEETVDVDQARLENGFISPLELSMSKAELEKNRLAHYFVVCDLAREMEQLDQTRQLYSSQSSVYSE